MEPTKYANMDNVRPDERAGLLLDIEQHSNPRLSVDTDPFVDDPLAEADDDSSKESRQEGGHFSTPRSAPTAAAPTPQPQLQPASAPASMPATHSAHGAGLPLPVTAWREPSDMVWHLLSLGPKIILSLVWFSLLVVWGAMSIVYLAWWLFLQAFTCFTRVHTDKYMVRRDIGGIFNSMMDMFEEIW